jgi:flagellar basal-body rod protein FlgB
MTDPISGSAVDRMIGTALNGLAVRQKAISNNLANVDTPGFKAFEVHFEEQLREQLGQNQAYPTVRLTSSNPKHFASGVGKEEDGKPELVRSSNTVVRADGNNVDIDKEMVQLAENTITYNALVQLTSARLSLARYVINEGRR